jgi:hypothetical protein
MTGSSSQKAGNDSTQIIVHYGIDERLVREIVDEQLQIILENYSEKARDTAKQRNDIFGQKLIEKMDKINGFKVFSDPSFQVLLKNAQEAAASIEREADYDLLSELMAYRFQKGENPNTRTGIIHAVKIVNEISDEALLGLTVFHSVVNLNPTSGYINIGLDRLDQLFGEIIYAGLPKGYKWLDQLDILKAVRIFNLGNLGKIEKLEDYYSKRLSGYSLPGLKEDSKELLDAKNKLSTIKVPAEILVKHELQDNYWRINVVNKSQISELCKTPLTENQKLIIGEIFDSYVKDPVIKKEFKEKFVAEWCKRKNLKILRDWWNNDVLKLNTSINITCVGEVLAHVNAQRCDKSLPSLD